MNPPQRVHFGYTISGKPGLFTGNFLAWPMDADQVTRWDQASRKEREQLCAWLGFELEADPQGHTQQRDRVIIERRLAAIKEIR